VLLLAVVTLFDTVAISRSDALEGVARPWSWHVEGHYSSRLAFAGRLPALRSTATTSLMPGAVCAQRASAWACSRSTRLSNLGPARQAALPVLRQPGVGVTCSMSRGDGRYSDDAFWDDAEEDGMGMVTEDDMDDYRLVLLRDSKVCPWRRTPHTSPSYCGSESMVCRRTVPADFKSPQIRCGEAHPHTTTIRFCCCGTAKGHSRGAQRSCALTTL